MVGSLVTVIAVVFVVLRDRDAGGRDHCEDDRRNDDSLDDCLLEAALQRLCSQMNVNAAGAAKFSIIRLDA